MIKIPRQSRTFQARVLLLLREVTHLYSRRLINSHHYLALASSIKFWSLLIAHPAVACHIDVFPLTEDTSSCWPQHLASVFHQNYGVCEGEHIVRELLIEQFCFELNFIFHCATWHCTANSHHEESSGRARDCFVSQKFVNKPKQVLQCNMEMNSFICIWSRFLCNRQDGKTAVTNDSLSLLNNQNPF